MAQKEVVIEFEGQRYRGMLDEVPTIEVLSEFTDPKTGEVYQTIRKPSITPLPEPTA